MTAQVPNMRETLDNGVIQQIPDIFREFRYGSMFDNLVRSLSMQSFGPVAGGAAVTFANLGLPNARHTNFVVQAVDSAGAAVVGGTPTTTGFTLAAGAGVAGVVINGGQFVEIGTVAANAITLSSKPNAILDVVATTGTTLGRKTLIIDADPNRAVSDGEVVWDGTTGLRFAAADAVTQVKVILSPTTLDTTSLLQRLLGARD